MESDSESEVLRARFEALKIPVGATDYPKAQLCERKVDTKLSVAYQH